VQSRTTDNNKTRRLSIIAERTGRPGFTSYRDAGKSLARQDGNISTIYIYIYIYITRLASNEIFSPSNKIQREVGRAKDLSVSLYVCVCMYVCVCVCMYVCTGVLISP
jgi:hypothetical protein